MSLIYSSYHNLSKLTQVNCPGELNIIALSVFVYTANAKAIVSFTWYTVTEDLHGGRRVSGQALQPLL